MPEPIDTEALAELVACRVVELLRGTPQPEARAVEWVDAARVAAQFGMSRDWVYSHVNELGGVRLGASGSGRRPRLRFDLAEVAAVLTARVANKQSEPMEVPADAPVQPRPRRRPLGTEVPLLPIHQRSGRS